MKEDFENVDQNNEYMNNSSGMGNASGSGSSMLPVNDQYWREKEKTMVSTKINAHKCIIAHKSSYFAQYFLERASSTK